MKDEGLPPDIVAAARELLGQFGPELTRPQAALLLRYWRRRDQLTPEAAAAVLAEYPKDNRAWMRRDGLEFGLWADR